MWLRPAWGIRDRSNPWIIITSTETLVAGTVCTVPIKTGGKILINYVDPNTCPEKTRLGWPEEFRTNMKRMFKLIIMDEEPKYKNRFTQFVV